MTIETQLDDELDAPPGGALPPDRAKRSARAARVAEHASIGAPALIAKIALLGLVDATSLYALIVPAAICASSTSATRMKYLPTARWLGVSGPNFASTGSIGASSGSFSQYS